jgi:hypothetical protein
MADVYADRHCVTALALVQHSLAAGKLAHVRVASSSMQPLLRPGDMLWIERTPAGTLRPGDVLTVRLDNSLLTHRLLWRDAAGWHMGGDSCTLPDAPVAATAIVGRVVCIERGTRYIVLQGWLWALLNRLLGWSGLLAGRLMQQAHRPQAAWQVRLAAAGARQGRRLLLGAVALLLHEASYATFAR